LVGCPTEVMECRPEQLADVNRIEELLAHIDW
jgi:hypothetical protein